MHPGTRLGPYEILAPIGAGGMGEVWKARDTRLNRIVAIKQLKGRHSARFEQEARAIASLNHPHICTLYDVGPDYLVMEYLDGAPLRGPIAVEEAVRLARQIASALDAAHSKGILHRDLKPDNVVVSGGSAKLLDFGLAKLAIDIDKPDVTKTVEGTVLGTVGYMSPEQAQGQTLDERSDIFSFGALLYEVLSGQPAFPGRSTAETLSAVLRDEPRPIGGSDAHRVPEVLGRIVMRCLRKAPAERFQRMSEVKAALDHLPSAGAGAEQPSIAVLPFADMSPGKDNEYFSDGLAEEIINALAQIAGLKVIARTSAFAFKGQNIDIRRIAETLGVAHVLEGSVRKAGSRIRVTAQLITASDGAHLWSERYDRELADVFAVQDEIAAAITGALQTRLGTAPMAARAYTPSVAGYEAYLRGRHYQWKIAPESLARSGEHFEQAIASDPEFALAHSGLSLSYFMRAMFSLMPANEAMPLVRINAERALALEPSLADAHAMLGIVAALYDYDWPEAGRRFDIALSREPVHPGVRSAYGLFYLMYAGRAVEAVDVLQREISADPLSPVLRYHVGVCLLAAGRVEEAVANLRQVLELDDKFMTSYGMLAFCHEAKGHLAEALVEADRAYALASWDPVIVGLLAGLCERTGDTGRAREVVKGLGDGTGVGAPTGFVTFHLLCREIDLAADWMEKAIAQRYPGVLGFVNLPFGRPLRESTRWPALARLMNRPV